MDGINYEDLMTVGDCIEEIRKANNTCEQLYICMEDENMPSEHFRLVCKTAREIILRYLDQLEALRVVR